MNSTAVLHNRALIPVSTIEKTVIGDRTARLVIYKTLVSKPSVMTLGLTDFLAGLESEGSVLSASRSAAASAAVGSKETHQVSLTTLRPVVSIQTFSVGRVAPELAPIVPIVTVTRTATATTTTTASSDNSSTAKPSPSNPQDNSISITLSNDSHPNPTLGGSISPSVIVGIVFGVVMGLVVAAVLVGLLLRKRRRTRHSSSRHHASNPSPPSAPVPMYVVPRPAEPPSEMPWPGLPDSEYFAPKKMDEEDEVPHQLPKRPRMSGETFLASERA